MVAVIGNGNEGMVAFREREDSSCEVAALTEKFYREGSEIT